MLEAEPEVSLSTYRRFAVLARTHGTQGILEVAAFMDKVGLQKMQYMAKVWEETLAQAQAED